MVGLVGETLLCTDTIYRKKNPVYTVTRSCKHLPCADWKPSEGCPESATVTSIFSQYVPARSRFPSVPLPLPPSTFLTIRLWRSRPLLGHDWMRHGATQILCLHTHAEKCGKRDGIQASVCPHSGTSRRQFHHDAAADKVRFAKAPKGSAATE